MKNENYRGLQIQYLQDNYTDDPRNGDNLGKMVCRHRRYKLGDKHSPEIEQKEFKRLVWLPIYMYEHSEITISTSPFSCPWDSGQVGYIYATREAMMKEFNAKRITKKVIAKTTEILQAEVRTYNEYLRGEVYEYRIIDPNTGDCLSSCGGFYGSDKEYMSREAKEDIDSIVDERLEEAAKKMEAESFPAVGECL